LFDTNPHRAAGASSDGRLQRCEAYPIGNDGGLNPAGYPDRSTGVNFANL